MSDEAEIVAVLEQAYDALAFPPGTEPDWARFTTVFSDGALLALRLFPQDRDISVLTLEDYTEAQLGNGLKEEGYSETPGSRRVDIVGDVATVRQEFTMNFAGRAPVPAVDVFSLARLGGAWRVVSVISDTTRVTS